MKRVWIILVLEATCQAVPPVVGNLEVYPGIAANQKRHAEPFIMPADGTIEALSIYHEGGRGAMLLGVYLGSTAPGVRIGVTPPTPVRADPGWQTAALTVPVWVPQGTRIWLAWVFEESAAVRYGVAPAGSVESDQGWGAGMPTPFGSGRQTDHVHSISAAYLGNAHLVINEVLPRNDSLTSSSFLDEDWRKQGWIELYNPSDVPVHLANYFLSDRRDTPQKWAFPDVVIGAHDFLRVWTSEEDRRDPAKPLHTSFNLMDTESILLAYAPPELQMDVLEEVKVPVDHSYGRYPDGTGNWYFYTLPTPQSANTRENRKQFVIDQRQVSLTVGTAYHLTVTPPAEKVIWSSDNPLVWVDPGGGLLAAQDARGRDARAVVTASSLDGTSLDSCEVTIVDWAANLSELKVVATPYASYILATEGDRLYYTKYSDLYVTSDGFQSSQFLFTLPEEMEDPRMLVTPFGYFVKCSKTIFASHDLIHWTPSFAMNMRGLQHSLDYDWDPASQTGYIYACEYSSHDEDRHRVCRGTFPATGEPRWETVLDFASLDEWRRDHSLLDAARHVHTVAVDPYTGHVWVGTGDTDAHSKLLYSEDHGDSFRLVGMGSQVWRTLSIWFTERYVYWAMDAYDDQSCWRIPRSRFTETGHWPCMTPELTSGMTRAGIRYLVTASETEAYFPVPVGSIYRETVARPLNGKNRVRVLDAPEYDYKEKVAELLNGTLWYHSWVQDEQGDSILILGQAAEGAQRDYRGRVFGIKELPSGDVDVQELLSVSSRQPDLYNSDTMYVQLQPQVQDTAGYIYFTGWATGQRSYKTRLTWIDNPSLR
jgi:hypothetical protein